MLNFLVETKKEYTIQLANLVFFKIYEGFNSLYKKSIEKTTEEEVLKNFQKSLKKVPKWDQNLIDNETTRICMDNYEIIENLLKAIVKSNMMMLTYDPRSKRNNLDITKYDIKVNKLIHQIYIECAREIFNNPFLFYHKYNPLELKRNQRDIFKIIKNSVEEAIRKLLPMKDILEIYLGNNFTPTEVIEKISEKEPIVNMPTLQNNQPMPNIREQPTQLASRLNQPLIGGNNNNFKGNANVVENTNPLIDNKKDTIQSILDRNDVNLSSSSDINKNFIKKVQEHETVERTKSNEKSLDSKIKKILDNDLNDSEDISLSYKPEETENYQEVFGNSEKNPVKSEGKVITKEIKEIKEISKEHTNNESINSINTVEKKNLMRKNKFFNNYINF